MEGGAGKIVILSTLSTNHKARKKKSGFHNSRYRFKCSHTISMKNLNVKHWEGHL